MKNGRIQISQGNCIEVLKTDEPDSIQTCVSPPDTNRETIPCTVLDPFAGSGTTGLVAMANGRSARLIELSEKYAVMITERITKANV